MSAHTKLDPVEEWRTLRDSADDKAHVTLPGTGPVQTTLWTCIAAEHDGEVDVSQIGRQTWDVEIPVSDESTAVILATALGGEWSRYCSHRHPGCPFLVRARREVPR
jgi:hypothetical protein